MSKFIVNSFQLPNAVVDDLMAKMNEAQLKCYLVIVRKTLGWGKEWDKISTTQIMKITGIKDKRTVYSATKFLEENGLIGSTKDQGKLTSYRVVTLNATSDIECKKPVTLNATTTSDIECYPTKDTKQNTINKSEFDSFIEDIKSKAKYKSKVTSTKEGKILFKQIEDKNKLVNDYLDHQREKGEFAVRITKFMEDYNTVYKNQSSKVSHTDASKLKVV